MPRIAGAVNNEFLPTESIARSPVVLCRHCRSAKVTKSSSKRKVAHLRKCPGYRAFLGDSPMPNFDSDMAAEDTDDVDEGNVTSMGGIKDGRNYPMVDSDGARVVSALPYAWPLASRISADTTALVILDMQRDFCEPDGLLAQMGHSVAAARSIVQPIASLLDLCRSIHLPVFHCRHSHRHDLSTLSALDRVKYASPGASPAPVRADGDHMKTSDSSSRATRPSLPLPGTPGPLGHFLLRQSAGTNPIIELRPLYQEALVDHPRPSAFPFTDLDLLLRNRGIQNLILVGLDVNNSLISTARDAADCRYDILLVEGCIASVSAPYPHTYSPPDPRDLLDLTRGIGTARQALDDALPHDWRPPGSSGPGAIAPYTSLMTALMSLKPGSIASTSLQPRQHHQQSPGPPRPESNHSTVHNIGSSQPTPPQQHPFIAPPLSSGPQSLQPPPLAPRPPTQPPTALQHSQTKQGYPYTPPGGRAGAGGRRGRGINDPIFYSPPKSGVTHPQRRAGGKTKTSSGNGGASVSTTLVPAASGNDTVGSDIVTATDTVGAASNKVPTTVDHTVPNPVLQPATIPVADGIIAGVRNGKEQPTIEEPNATGGNAEVEGEKTKEVIEEVIMTDEA